MDELAVDVNTLAKRSSKSERSCHQKCNTGGPVLGKVEHLEDRNYCCQIHSEPFQYLYF